jgi:hypothetical protein
MKIFKKIVTQLSTVGLFFFVSTWAYAERAPMGPSLGDMANAAMEPVTVFTKVMFSLCYVIGVTLIVGSFIQYKEHRANPVYMPINRPIIMCILGLALVAVPFIVRISAENFSP